VFSARLTGAERPTGLAYARAVMRTINTHLADGYGDEAVRALAEALSVSEDEVAAGPAPLFDWELREGTTERIQDSMAAAGSIGYERPAAEATLLDRSVYTDAVTEG
jgi:NitT/TauT family transport system substrate-binding protein